MNYFPKPPLHWGLLSTASLTDHWAGVFAWKKVYVCFGKIPSTLHIESLSFTLRYSIAMLLDLIRKIKHFNAEIDYFCLYEVYNEIYGMLLEPLDQDKMTKSQWVSTEQKQTDARARVTILFVSSEKMRPIVIGYGYVGWKKITAENQTRARNFGFNQSVVGMRDQSCDHSEIHWLKHCIKLIKVCAYDLLGSNISDILATVTLLYARTEEHVWAFVRVWYRWRGIYGP